MENKKQSFKEVFSDMKDLFKDIFKDEIVNQKFADYKAQDGTIVRTDTEEIAIGSKLQVITPDGVMDVPAEVTELVILINDVPNEITVENGIVKGIEPVAADEGMPTDNQPIAQGMSSQEFEAKFAELNDRLSKLEAALGLANQSLEAANKTINTQNDLNKKLFSLIEKVADAPSVAPLSEAKNNSKKQLSSLEEFRKKFTI